MYINRDTCSKQFLIRNIVISYDTTMAKLSHMYFFCRMHNEASTHVMIRSTSIQCDPAE